MCPIFCSTTTQKHEKKKQVSSVTLQTVHFFATFQWQTSRRNKKCAQNTLYFLPGPLFNCDEPQTQTITQLCTEEDQG